MLEKQILKEKDKKQKEAVESIITAGGKGIISCATGFGKSRIPILYAKDKRTNVNPKKVALIVPTRFLRDEGWKKEFEAWRGKTIYKGLTLLCYRGIDKVVGKEFDLVILDEAHNITEKSAQFFKNNKVRDCIALTATMPKEQEKLDIFSSLGLKEVFSFGLKESQENHFVAPFDIDIVYLGLESFKKEVLVKAKKPFYVTESQMYDFLNKNVEIAKLNRNEVSFKRAIGARTNFIYGLKSKVSVLKALEEKYKGQRNLFFCGNIQQAEELGIPTFHSKSSMENLIAFKEEKIDSLASVKALNEGHNIPNLDNGIIGQVNSNTRDLLQRIGRVIRWREGHKAKIIILVAKNTQDEVWLESALENIDTDNINYYTLDSYF